MRREMMLSSPHYIFSRKHRAVLRMEDIKVQYSAGVTADHAIIVPSCRTDRDSGAVVKLVYSIIE